VKRIEQLAQNQTSVSGDELARQILAMKRSVRCLYMSIQSQDLTTLDRSN